MKVSKVLLLSGIYSLGMMEGYGVEFKDVTVETYGECQTKDKNISKKLEDTFLVQSTYTLGVLNYHKKLYDEAHSSLGTIKNYNFSYIYTFNGKSAYFIGFNNIEKTVFHMLSELLYQYPFLRTPYIEKNKFINEIPQKKGIGNFPVTPLGAKYVVMFDQKETKLFFDMQEACDHNAQTKNQEEFIQLKREILPPNSNLYNRHLKKMDKCLQSTHANTPDAQIKLALMYENTIKNSTKAFNLYKKAADQHNAEAQFHLGRCYENGIGTIENIVKAYDYYLKAGINGYIPAYTNINNLITKYPRLLKKK